MSKLLGLVLALGLALSVSGCGGAKLSPKAEKAFKHKQTMYTKVNMHYQYGAFGRKVLNVANYAQGLLLPVNSKVTFKDINSKQLSFYHDGQLFILRNNPKYSGTDIGGVVDKYFSSKPVDLHKFTKMEQKIIAKPDGTQVPLRVIPRPFVALRLGGYGITNLKKGMSKKAVLIARGYPPVHGTTSLDSNEWKYWEDPQTTTTVLFKNGKSTKVLK